MDACPVTRLGEVIPEEMFRLKGANEVAVAAPLAELKEAWQRPLRW